MAAPNKCVPEARGTTHQDMHECTNGLLMLCKVGDKCLPLQRTSDLSFALDHTIANKVIVIHIWLNADEMNFMPKFDPSNVKQLGKTSNNKNPNQHPMRTSAVKAMSHQHQKLRNQLLACQEVNHQSQCCLLSHERTSANVNALLEQAFFKSNNQWDQNETIHCKHT